MLSDELRSHVDMLAARIGDRNYVFYKNLEQAAAYIEQTLSGMGYATIRQEFSARGQKFSNIIAERRGGKQPGQVIIIGAHYDCSLGSEGADDNGSAVAALLALARAFSAKNPGCTVRFAFSSTMMFRGGQSYSVALRINQVTKWDRSDNVIVYADELATVFDVLSDLDNPMWFKFKQPFEVAIY